MYFNIILHAIRPNIWEIIWGKVYNIYPQGCGMSCTKKHVQKVQEGSKKIILLLRGWRQE